MKIVRSLVTGTVCLAVVAGTVLVVPPAVSAGRLLLTEVQPDEIVAYRLSMLAPSNYVSAIEAALVAEDADLADSLVSLADRGSISLPADLRARVKSAQEFDMGRSMREVWKGLSGGDAASPEALAGAVAADLGGISDVRDLIREGDAFVDDRPYDALTLGLATVGLVATGLTIASLGTAAPARAGLTAVKVASRAGTMRPPLLRALVSLSTDLIDRPALNSGLTLLKSGDITAARAAIGRSVRAAPLQTIRTMGDDLATLASTRGYRAAHDVLRISDNPRDISRLSLLSARLGRGFRGSLALLGPAALTIAGLMATITGWLLAAGLWLIGAFYVAWRILRFGWRMSRGMLRLVTRLPLRQGVQAGR